MVNISSKHRDSFVLMWLSCLAICCGTFVPKAGGHLQAGTNWFGRMISRRSIPTIGQSALKIRPPETSFREPQVNIS